MSAGQKPEGQGSRQFLVKSQRWEQGPELAPLRFWLLSVWIWLSYKDPEDLMLT